MADCDGDVGEGVRRRTIDQETQMDVANDIDARRFAVGVMALDALRQLSPESMKQRSLQPQLLIQQD